MAVVLSTSESEWIHERGFPSACAGVDMCEHAAIVYFWRHLLLGTPDMEYTFQRSF